MAAIEVLDGIDTIEHKSKVIPESDEECLNMKETLPRDLPAFYFKRRHGRIDWRKLDRVDLETLVNEVDVDTLQEHVDHIAFADVGEEDLRYFTDASFLKLFRVAQLTIEYLLYVQDYLLQSAAIKDKRFSQASASVHEENKKIQQKNEEIKLLKKELKYSRKVVSAYERLAGPLLSGKNTRTADKSLTEHHIAEREDETPQVAFKCNLCRSMFISEHHLANHKRRRHSVSPNEARVVDAPVTVVAEPSSKERPALVSDVEKIVSGKVTELLEKFMQNNVPRSPSPSHVDRSLDEAIERAVSTISSKQSLEMSQRLAFLEGKLESFATNTAQNGVAEQYRERRRRVNVVGPLESADANNNEVIVGTRNHFYHTEASNINHRFQRDDEPDFSVAMRSMGRELLDEMRGIREQNNISQTTKNSSDGETSLTHIKSVENDDKNDSELDEMRRQKMAAEIRLVELETQMKTHLNSTNVFEAKSDEALAVDECESVVQNDDKKDDVIEQIVCTQLSSSSSSSSSEKISHTSREFTATRAASAMNLSSASVESELRDDEVKSKSIFDEDFDESSFILHEESEMIENENSCAEIDYDVNEDESIQNISSHSSSDTVSTQNPITSPSTEALCDAKTLQTSSHTHSDENSAKFLHTVFEDEPFSFVKSSNEHNRTQMRQDLIKYEEMVESCMEEDYEVMRDYIEKSGYDSKDVISRLEQLSAQHYVPAIAEVENDDMNNDDGSRGDALDESAHYSKSISIHSDASDARAASVLTEECVSNGVCEQNNFSFQSDAESFVSSRKSSQAVIIEQKPSHSELEYSFADSHTYSTHKHTFKSFCGDDKDDDITMKENTEIETMEVEAFVAPSPSPPPRLRKINLNDKLSCLESQQQRLKRIDNEYIDSSSHHQLTLDTTSQDEKSSEEFHFEKHSPMMHIEKKQHETDTKDPLKYCVDFESEDSISLM